MKNKIKFSIVIPCYNLQDYIVETLESLKNQKYDNIEVICVDDCSKDKTLEILEKYKKQNKKLRMKILKQNSNLGVSQARNNGLEIAKGDYIIFLDGDDYLNKNSLKIISNSIDKNNFPDFIGYGYKTFTKSNKSSVLTSETTKKMQNMTRDMVEKYLLKKVIFGIGSFSVKRTFLKKNNLKFSSNISYSEDQQFIIKNLLLSKSIINISLKLLNYRQRTGSTMNRKVCIERATSLKAIEELKEFIKNKELKKYENLIEFYFSTMIIGLLNEIGRKDTENLYEMFEIIDKYKLELKNSLKISFVKRKKYLFPILCTYFNPKIYLKIFKFFKIK